MHTSLWGPGWPSLYPAADLSGWVCLAGFESQTHNTLSDQPRVESASLSGSVSDWEEKKDSDKQKLVSGDDLSRWGAYNREANNLITQC